MSREQLLKLKDAEVEARQVWQKAGSQIVVLH